MLSALSKIFPILVANKRRTAVDVKCKLLCSYDINVMFEALIILTFNLNNILYVY